MPILHLDLPMAHGRALQVLGTGLVALGCVAYLLYRDYRASVSDGGESP